MSALPPGLQGLDDREVTIGGVRFAFQKMPAMAGYHALELIRAEIAKTQSPSGEFMRDLMALPPAFVEQLRHRMFEHVRFTTATSSSLLLAGAEDMAFDGLDPLAVYEVLLRSLAVNFSPSYHELLSRLGLSEP